MLVGGGATYVSKMLSKVLRTLEILLISKVRIFCRWFALDRALKWSQIHQNQFLECSRRSFCHLGHLFIFTTAFFLRFSATSLVASEERNYDTANCVRTSRSPAKSKCMRAYSILFLPRLTQAQGDYLYDGRSKS